MSLFFKPSLKEKYTPKTIQLSQLYHATTGGHKLSGSAFSSAQQALKKAGFSDDKIRKVLYRDVAISVKEMQLLAETLNRARVYGFEKSPTTAIKTYLNKERVKAQSIANRLKENILEAAEENLTSYGTTSLNTKGISPNAPKPGEPSILARSRRHSNAVSSLSSRSNSQPTSSFKSTRGAASSLGRPTGSSGLSPRPRY